MSACSASWWAVYDRPENVLWSNLRALFFLYNDILMSIFAQSEHFTLHLNAETAKKDKKAREKHVHLNTESMHT